mgnify:CR=1 FL=1|tara:strand:+ start:58993 stop:59640 length:648 start_codon:yes stop_codon:yes gene_type:complete
MKKFQSFKGIVLPIDRSNIDTDAIIPKQFLKSIHRTGFGQNLFDEWRYLDHGEPGQDCSLRPLNEDFVINKKRYKNASILLARDNFGCGSSREHAPWALSDFGIKTIIAESYAEIFYNNCFKNGILPIMLRKDNIETLFENTFSKMGFSLSVDLKNQILIDNDLGHNYDFSLEESRKEALISGLDEIGMTLTLNEKIKEFEVRHKDFQPWLFTKL